MSELNRTVLHEGHLQLGAQMVPFGGWDMPVMYGGRILAEHLATRKGAGMFDASHMGRFVFRGLRALEFLQYALTNNAAALDPVDKGAQYTLIPTQAGTAVDDAYLYRFVEDEYLLVVNAGNRDKDWQHLQALVKDFNDVSILDRSHDMANLPRMVRPLVLADRGIARQGNKVFKDDRHVGYVTSGTMVPYWEFEGQSVHAELSDNTQRRSICLAYLDSDILDEEPLSVEVRGKPVAAMAVAYHMRSESPP